MAVTVGDRIRRKRKEDNLTQVDVAQMAEVSQSYISKIESGSEDFTLSFLARIADILNVPPAYLLEGAVVPTDSQTQDGLRVLHYLEALYERREYGDMIDVVSGHKNSLYFTSSIHNRTELSLWEIKAYVGLYEFNKASEICDHIIQYDTRMSDLTLASIFEMYGVSKLYLRQPAKAKDLLNKAHCIANKEERASHIRLKRSISYHLGLAYSDMGDIKESERYLNNASRMLDTEIKFHMRRHAKIEFVRGANKYLSNDLERANDHFKKSYGEYMRCEDIGEAARALNNMAYLSKVMDDGGSKKYYVQLQKLSQQYPDKIPDVVLLEADREGYSL